MNQQLTAVLSQFRIQRNFRPQEYLWAKSELVNDYFRKSGLTTAIVGVSGGVDSAVTLGILDHARRHRESPIKNVVSAILPIERSNGASNQTAASERGRLAAARFESICIEADLSGAVSGYKSTIDLSARRIGSAWAEGQLASYSRTPALYYIASLYTDNDDPAVVCGTTNRDEGAYIGFFGKASDGMVDLQIISDLHKSEVYKLGQLLQVPEPILTAVPSGDTYDGRSDAEMIGTDYDAIELYLSYLCLKPKEQKALLDLLSEEARCEFDQISCALTRLHMHNRHKYQIAAQAIHFDLYPRAVPGGWPDNFSQEEPSTDSINTNQLVSYFQPEETSILNRLPLNTEKSDFALLFPGQKIGYSITNLLASDECQELLAELSKQNWEPVGIDGRRPKDHILEVGSLRATTISNNFASAIWDRIRPILPTFKKVTQESFTDGTDTIIWRAIGINPVLRFISYANNGELIPHYDAGYDFQDGHRHTLMSLIIYLNDAPKYAGGETRFIKDPQRFKNYEDRNFNDWMRTAKPSEVLLEVTPAAGSAILFDHRLLHDCARWNADVQRTILRTDIIFERCGLQLNRYGSKTNTEPKRLEAKDLPKISTTMSSADVDRCFKQYLASAITPPPEDFYATWKALRDPFYRPIYFERQQLSDALEAGFFVDSGNPGVADTSRHDVNWMVTPLHKLQDSLDQLNLNYKVDLEDSERPLLVLLSTGSFCPIHEGHIQMLSIAKQTLEAQGETVLGGYLSPSNDEYVKKKCGADSPSGVHRLELCEAAVAKMNWLAVDPWEALHCDYDVNFTVTIERLEEYLNHHLLTTRPIKVVYVFGSDNANFMLTFKHKGRCVCIPRPGYDEFLDSIRQHVPKSSRNRIFVADHQTHDASSTKIRSGDFSMLDGAVLSKWASWLSVTENSEAESVTLGLRDEGTLITQHWENYCSKDKLNAARCNFLDGLLGHLKESFIKAHWPEQKANLITKVFSLEDQLLAIKNLNRDEIISLDPFVPAKVNLGVSRCFSIVDAQSAKGITCRPGWPELDVQVQSIPFGTYTLLDDDHFTGSTESRVRALIGSKCEIKNSIDLVGLLSPDDNFLDLGDSRDFLVGAWEGGLVAQLPNKQICRAPYLYPYVRPSQRLSLPISQDISFSLAVWQLNQHFFSSLDNTIRISHCPLPFQELTSYLGFASELSLIDFCDWHIERLKLSNKPAR